MLVRLLAVPPRLTPFESYVNAGDMVNQGIGHYYTKLLVKGSYPSPFSLDSSYGPKFPESGFDLPVNKEVSGIIREISRRKYGRDINIIAQDIQERSQLSNEEKGNNQEDVLSSVF